AAAQKGNLLLRKRDYFDGAIAKRNPEHHSEHAVERAGIRYGVDVGADHQPRARSASAAHIADRVDPDGEPGLLHPRRHLALRRSHRGGAIRARDAAGLFRETGEHAAAANDPGGVHRYDPRYVV